MKRTTGSGGSHIEAESDATPANNAVNPPHSVVTALAKGGKRRAAGRAGYRERWADKKTIEPSVRNRSQ